MNIYTAYLAYIVVIHHQIGLDGTQSRVILLFCQVPTLQSFVDESSIYSTLGMLSSVCDILRVGTDPDPGSRVQVPWSPSHFWVRIHYPESVSKLPRNAVKLKTNMSLNHFFFI